jgi:hypothetical protein
MRDAMLATSAALARLLMRMNDLSHASRANDAGYITPAADANWCLSDLKPPSPLLAGSRDASLSSAISRVMKVQAWLLAACASTDELDPLWVCRVLLALGDDFANAYPPAVKKMADIAGATLPASPRDLHHGLGLGSRIHPGAWRPQTSYSMGATPTF